MLNMMPCEAVGVAAKITAALPNIKRGSLVVFGDIFGGRIDNIHSIVGVQANPDESVTISFNEGEILTIWNPAGLTVNANEFRVAQATRVRWEWFYYGREKLPENRYYIEHESDGETVTVTTDQPFGSSYLSPSIDGPAVELL